MSYLGREILTLSTARLGSPEAIIVDRAMGRASQSRLALLACLVVTGEFELEKAQSPDGRGRLASEGQVLTVTANGLEKLLLCEHS